MVSKRLQNAYIPDVISEDELEYFEKGGHGARMGWGERPGVLVVDMTNEFTSDNFDLGRSDTGGSALDANKKLLEKAREARLPIFFTLVDDSHAHIYPRTNAMKKESGFRGDPEANEIHPELAPRNDEFVIEKYRASAFFDTHLGEMLRHLKLDTLIITGMTTSGCVRASVIDASSSNFHVIVPEECVADRCKTPHEVSLFDMDMKYADVTSVEEAINKIEVQAASEIA